MQSDAQQTTDNVLAGFFIFQMFTKGLEIHFEFCDPTLQREVGRTLQDFGCQKINKC